MAKINAERQADYRRRHLDELRIIGVVVAVGFALALEFAVEFVAVDSVAVVVVGKDSC